MKKIAIILTTFLRDDLLRQAVNSIEYNWQDCWQLIIVDQNPTEEKQHLYKKHIYEAAPYNSGLSYSRNIGVKLASKLNIPYCLITADSIAFTQNLKNIEYVANELSSFGYKTLDLIGFDLENRIKWEADLSLIPEKYFEMTFIDTEKTSDIYSVFHPVYFRVYRCDIVRNFFLATTESLLKVQWDNNLKMREHEDFFWRFKEADMNVGWTPMFSGKYIGTKDTDYHKMRTVNMNEGLRYLQKKYNIKGWINYKHEK